ncbi:unnamed protein product [Brassica rapa]|uniref:Uncharacterized protein n=1 Tax=Brassica campestris TaxID=3711 RepID=A0A8D9DCJ0_BRACM|nr:unnamed protein product [Brassica rapa]
MEKVERQSEEASYLWLPFHFLNQTIKAILRCLGILHHDPPTVTKTSSDSAPLNQPEEEEDVVMPSWKTTSLWRLWAVKTAS